jgi:hypothetical protein
MLHARKGRCAVLVLALLVAPVLSGCAGSSEPSAAPVAAARGFVGGVVSELKREDDETERKEMREAAPQTKEEREQAHEQAEQAAVQSRQASEESEGS